MPEGYHINPDALPEVSVWSDEKTGEPVDNEISTAVSMFEVPVKINNANGKLNVEVLIYYCDTENAGICKFRDLFFEIPVTVASSGNDAVEISYTLN